MSTLLITTLCFLLKSLCIHRALQPLGSLKLMANLNLKGNVVSTTDNYVDKVASVLIP